jgi:Mg-chelatase subunit ChlD
MLKRLAYVLFLITFTLGMVQTQFAQGSCSKSFRVTGTGVDGQPKNFVMTVRRPLVEVPSFNQADQEISDFKQYGQRYTINPGSATSKMNCAGYVMNKLWPGSGNTYYDEAVFYSLIILNFGKKLTDIPDTPKIGDVVHFSNGKHIAVVVEPSNSNNEAVIESKDNQESLLHGKLFLNDSMDPITIKNGTPVIYRLVNFPTITPLSPDQCDSPVDMTVTIDVNESLSGKLTPVKDATVVLQLQKTGEKLPALQTDGKGLATHTFSKSDPEKINQARTGIMVTVSKVNPATKEEEFYQKQDSIPANMFTTNDVFWNMTLTRKPDEKLAAWQKRLDALIAKIAALEARRTAALSKLKEAQTSGDKVRKAEKEIKKLLEQLKDSGIKQAVTHIQKYCQDAAPLIKAIEDTEKEISRNEQDASKLSDEILKLADSCTTSSDAQTIRDKTTELTKLTIEMGLRVKLAQANNSALKNLQAQAQAEDAQIKKIADLRKRMDEQSDDQHLIKPHADALAAYLLANEAEASINQTKQTLAAELAQLRLDYPKKPMPVPTQQQLAALEVKLNNVTVGLSGKSAQDDLTKAAVNIQTLKDEADEIVKNYKAALCTIPGRDEVIKRIEDSMTLALLGLNAVSPTDQLVKKCELKTYCQEQIAKIEQALSIGDLETATKIIVESKGRGCNTYEVEQKWLKVQERVFDLLARAQLSWRDIDTHCNYQSAYDAAKALEKQFPKHPWLVKNLPDIERGWRADQQIKQLTQQLIVADKNRNYAEAERLIAEADKAAKPFPCLVKEAQRLRAEYLKGKPASPELEKECQALIAEIEQAIAAGKLTEAAQKLEVAQKRCGTVSPALFAKLKGLPHQLNDAIEQIPAKAEQSIGKCEYEDAYEMALELQKVNPAHPWLAKRLTKLQEEAAAQKKARQFLRPGLEAIQRKDINGAIAALKQAKEVQGVPACLANQVGKLLKDMEGRRDFMQMTEKVQLATRECDYAGAETLMKQIRAITPREQYITDWLGTNEPIIQELQVRKRRALALIDAAEKTVVQAENECQQAPANWDRVTALVKQAIKTLDEADQEAPKCLPERKRMEELRRRLAEVANRRKTNIAVSIVLLIDTSGSMGQNNKIENAKAAARAAVRNASKTTEIAVMHFDGGCGVGAVRTASEFTTNVNQLLQAIDTLKPGGGTPMYIATAVAVEYAKARVEKRLTKSAIVVLMSDGGDTCRGDQAKAAASISTSNIPVNTIGYDVGGDQNAVNDLSNLATMTNGRNYSATTADPKEIVNAFKIAVLPSLFKDFDLGGSGSAVQSHFDMAKTAVKQQDLNGATYQLQQAQRLAPDSPAVSFNLALVNEANDKPLAAIRNAENYLRLAPNALDRADVEGRIEQMRKEAQQNPRAEYDPAACRDVYNWALTERAAAKKAGNPARLQTVLEIQIAAQRGDCTKARQMQERYRQQFP